MLSAIFFTKNFISILSQQFTDDFCEVFVFFVGSCLEARFFLAGYACPYYIVLSILLFWFWCHEKDSIKICCYWQIGVEYIAISMVQLLAIELVVYGDRLNTNKSKTTDCRFRSLCRCAIHAPRRLFLFEGCESGRLGSAHKKTPEVVVHLRGE